MRSPVVHIYLLRGQVAVALLLGRVVMQRGVWKLHEDSGGAKVEMLGQEVVPSFGVGEAAAVGVDADRSLFDGTA